jgi:hypothetical protein
MVDGSEQPPPAADRVERTGADFALWVRVAWFVWLLLGLRLTVRGFDPDELEHLHAAFCLRGGQLPYRDFFEHHAPALYWLAQPVLFLTGPRLSALWILRLGMWLLSTLAVLSTARIARRVPGGWAAGLVPGLLLGSSILFSKGVEFRPDVPAMLLLIWALEWGLRLTEERLAGRSAAALTWRPWLLALFAGGATLFTQKAIVPVIALGMATWLVETLASRAWRWPAMLSWMLGGVVLGWSAVLIGYWWVGGASALVESTVLQLVKWSVPSEILPTFRATLAADLLIWWLAVVGGALGLARPVVRWLTHRGNGGAVPTGLSRHSDGETAEDRVAPSSGRAEGRSWLLAVTLARNGTDSAQMARGRLVDGESSPPCDSEAFPVTATIVLLATAACVGSLTVVKATFPQYYQLWFPWLVLAAGAGGRSLLTTGHTGWQRICLALGGLVLVAQMGWLARGALRGVTGPFPHLIGENPPGLALLAVGIFWLAWGLGWRGALADHRHRMLAWGGALALGYGVCRQLDQLAWSNAAQVRAIEQVHAEVPLEGRVLDGFTGWGALRPHAYRIWWLNEFSMGLIAPADLERDLLELFDQQPPDAVLDDENLRRLSPAVRTRIETEYEPVEPAPLRVRSLAPRR